jgi:hypothetical protein
MANASRQGYVNVPQPNLPDLIFLVYSDFHVNEPQFLFRAKAQRKKGAKEERNGRVV